MIPVNVKLHDRRGEATPLNLTGFSNTPTCNLAIIPARYYRRGKWLEDKGWMIAHRPTGYTLGGDLFDTREEAAAVLVSSQPDFPAWMLANGREGDAATSVCRLMYRNALVVNGFKPMGTVAS